MGLQPELQAHRPPTRIPERGSGYHDTGIGVGTYRAPTTVTIVVVAGNILPLVMSSQMKRRRSSHPRTGAQ